MNWESCLDNIKKLIQKEYARHYYLLESQKLLPHERNYFQKIIDLTGNKGDYANSLENLLIFLSRFYNSERLFWSMSTSPGSCGFYLRYLWRDHQFYGVTSWAGPERHRPYLKKDCNRYYRIAKESIISGLTIWSLYAAVKSSTTMFGSRKRKWKPCWRISNSREVWPRYNCGITVTGSGAGLFKSWSIINFLNSKGRRMKPYWIIPPTPDRGDFAHHGGKELKEELESSSAQSIEKASMKTAY